MLRGNLMITLRKAQSQDIDAVAKLMFLAMKDIVCIFLDTTDAEKGINFLRKHIAAPHNQYSLDHVIVAEEDGVILGQTCIYDGKLLEVLRQPIMDSLAQEYNRRLPLSDETQPGEMYIDTIAVAAHARGRGIAKLLLLYVIDLFVKQKGEVLGLLVDMENPQAKQLYIKMGFRIMGTKTIFGKEMQHMQYHTY